MCRSPLVVLLLASAMLRAQTIDELRDQLRQEVGNVRMMGFMAGLVDLGENPEMSGASMRVPDDPDLHVATLKLPYARDYDVGDRMPQVHLEATLGYFDAESTMPDLWSGGLPGFETAADLRWHGVSGYVGAGPRFDLGAGWHLTTVVGGSLCYLDSDANYSGPGAAFSAALLDGILFNWQATSVAYGSAVRLEHDTELSNELHLHGLLRYDLRFFDVIHSTDDAQDASDELQRGVIWAELSGPTGDEIVGRPLGWNAHLGYTRFLGVDLKLGFTDYFELGVGFTAPLRIDALPVDQLSLSAAVLYGEDLRGWTLGAAVNF